MVLLLIMGNDYMIVNWDIYVVLDKVNDVVLMMMKDLDVVEMVDN